MLIFVVDRHEREFVGASREELVEYLDRTSDKEYAAKVLDYFDNGNHEVYFPIQGGAKPSDIDLWVIKETDDLCGDPAIADLHR